MSAEGGTKAILAALGANLGIAATKFIAFLLSGASSMLAEAIHSVADSTNQVLLLVGQRRARRQADEEHPFGYGRSRYVYAFIVAIILFSVGGVFALYEGYEKVRHIQEHPDEPALDPFWWWLPLVVLAISIVLESISLTTALREGRKVKGDQNWVAFVRRAKSPEIPVVLLEDVAALIGLVLALLGVGLTVITGDGLYDALGTFAIGFLLVLVAVVLGAEMGSLLVGEGATAKDLTAIRAAIESHPAVERIIHIKTLYVGPEELMVGAKLAFPANRTLGDVAPDIDDVERAVREAVPAARIIYFEPDVYRADAAEPAPPTDTIVIKSAD
ncbi:MAG: cation diffusion facilitator family transporter [Microbacteriaceae bacterium]|nr:cation diffusion facilitator family transporter [Microbacteriaceae bacterium]